MEHYLYQSTVTLPSTTKGTEVMDGMILSQYKEKPNLREFMLAFVEEMDTLLKETEAVYLGRLLDNAYGHQLDVIGIILDQPRSVQLDTVWFGFQGAVSPDGMADEADPTDGGVFRGDDLQGYETYPLGDSTYRKLLLAKAQLLCVRTVDINTAYYSASILIGFVPEFMKIVTINPRYVQLQVSSDVSALDLRLVNYLGKYFVPVGTTFATLIV